MFGLLTLGSSFVPGLFSPFEQTGSIVQPVFAEDPTALQAPGSSPNSEKRAAPPSVSPEQDRLAQSIGETTMSPFCPGRTLSSCPSPQARELRDQIREWLAQGYSESGVRNQLRIIYGEEVRGTPPNGGWLGDLGWYAPFAFVLASLALVAMKVRSMARERRTTAQLKGGVPERGAPVQENGAEPSPETLAFVSRELDARIRR